MSIIPKTLSTEITGKYSILDNTFIQVAKDNPKDKIDIEIGDSKEPDFIPQQKIMRWDNECNVSIRLIEDDNETPTIETVGDKIKYIKKDKECHFYQIQNKEHPEGASEFEIILKKKPKTNVIKFSVVDKDVQYNYQPELTQKEIDEGCIRHENVVGSYAIYAKTPKTNWISKEQSELNKINKKIEIRKTVAKSPYAEFKNKTDLELSARQMVLQNFVDNDKKIYKEYKAGKIGHIYRPKIIDNAGTEVWGNLHIENGILSVNIPQEFLDNAVYPIRHAAGLTFGVTAEGASSVPRISTSSYRANTFVAARYTANSGDVITKLSVCGRTLSAGAGGTVGMSVYTWNGSVPVTRLLAEQTISIPYNAVNTWNDSGVLSQAMTGGIIYITAIGNFVPGASNLYFAYDATGYANSYGSAGALPATWSQAGTDATRWSHYATYTVAGAAFTPKIMFFTILLALTSLALCL